MKDFFLNNNFSFSFLFKGEMRVSEDVGKELVSTLTGSIFFSIKENLSLFAWVAISILLSVNVIGKLEVLSVFFGTYSW